MKRDRDDREFDYTTSTDSECPSAADSDDDTGDSADDSAGECDSDSPRFTTFPASSEWERSDAMREKKRAHQDSLDERHAGDREAHIYDTTLKGREWHLEANLFPYECDEGISHWTLWSRRDLRHREIMRLVTSWCREFAPWVAEWSYEENPHVSFCIPHVHVFFRRRTTGVLPQSAATADETPSAASRASASPARKRRRPTRWDVAPPTTIGLLPTVL